jgi:hypothetical protein
MRHVQWYRPGPGGLVWIARWGGIGLVVVGVLGWPLRTVPPLEWLNLSTYENVVHLLIAAPMLYAGFVRPDNELARRAIGVVAVVALAAAVVGFTPVPEAGVDAGFLPTDWSLVHQLVHIAAAAVFGGVWPAARKERERLGADAG